MAKKGTGKVGGLCRYLAKKHHWSKAKTDSCIKKSKRRHHKKK